MSVLKNTERKIDHVARLKGKMVQTYPIYACIGTNHERHVIGSRYILRWLEARVFKVKLKKLGR